MASAETVTIPTTGEPAYDLAQARCRISQLEEEIRRLRRVLPAALDPRADAPQPGMTVREREVLHLLATGLANKQIATRLGISEKTVKAHLTKGFRALGVTGRTQAVLRMQRSAEGCSCHHIAHFSHRGRR